jgi:hypothetical protein
MVLVKRNVPVQIPDDFVWQAADFFIAGIESLHFGCKAAVSALRHLDHFDPRMSREIAAYDIGSLVRRSIVHDHPFRR